MLSQTSIAVLPFRNMSSDVENEYFSDGITEEIINALSNIPKLKVIARTSSFAFKGQQIDIRKIGNQLGVNTILEGSVRKANNRVRIAAQLINTIDSTLIWSENFDRELNDIFSLQDEVSLLIAEKIRENFGHLEIKEVAKKTPTKNIEAYELFLKGSYFFKRKDFEDIKKAFQYFQEAIALDPKYAEAYAFMGETYLHFAGFGIMPNEEAHAKARASADKAIKLHAKEARAYKVLAYIHLFYDWQWDKALAAYSKAVEFGLPNENEFISYYFIFIQKEFELAINVAKRVVETDPLHIITHWQLGLCYYFAQQHENALNAFNMALSLDENFGEALRWKGLVLGYLGRFEEAILTVDKAIAVSNSQGPAVMDKLIIRILMGEAASVIPEIKRTEYLDPTDPAMMYALLNMPDQAIHFLQEGMKIRSVMMITLKHFWIWDNLRAEERFKSLYEQMNFGTQQAVPENLSQFTEYTLLSTSTQSSVLLNEEEVKYYLNELTQLMESTQLFLENNLSLRQLAEKIGLHPNKLSWLINEHLGKNYNEYINAFRLTYFQQKAIDPANSHFTLLGIAYESGFNSKSVFNDFFKKSTGMTPKQWVKQQQPI